MTQRWQQTLVDYLFVIAEAVVWFMAIALIATWTERDLLAQLATRIQTELSPSPAHLLALRDVRAASEQVISGPPLLIVVFTGMLAFAAMRGFRRLRLQGAMGAAGILIVSILVLNALLHFTFTRDVLFWQTGGAANFINDPATHFPPGTDLEAFIANPGLGRPHGGALMITFAGLVAMWTRFLLGGRSLVTFERGARSFTFGFSATLVLVVLASVSGVTTLAAYAVPYFVLAVLMLAVAHSARPQTVMEDARRAAPWVLSVLVTVGALTAAALILGLLALIDAGSWFQFVVDALFRVIGFLLVLILTPIFWVVEGLLSLANITPPENFLAPPQGTPGPLEPAESGDGFRFASSVVFVLKVIALSALTYGIFAGLRALLGRGGDREEEAYAEVRTTDANATGLGGLLRNLIPGRGARGAGGAWMRQQPIYQLFGRAVHDAEVRGLRIRPAETPIEFADVGGRMLEAAAFGPIADAFDRARYGRHFPDAEALAPLERALETWAASHPPSEEVRERIQGARQPSESQEIEARIILSRRASRGDENARRLL
ncbi:MAG: DUF4129 domain-containing protein [Chloroflexi bacterium]|nr:DUF4129 domain-containing protein [Chloroflexota bacterium]